MLGWIRLRSVYQLPFLSDLRLMLGLQRAGPTALQLSRTWDNCVEPFKQPRFSREARGTVACAGPTPGAAGTTVCLLPCHRRRENVNFWHRLRCTPLVSQAILARWVRAHLTHPSASHSPTSAFLPPSIILNSSNAKFWEKIKSRT